MSAPSSKVFFIVCALVQGVFSQCSSRAAVSAPGYIAPHAWSGPGLAYDGIAASAIPYDGLNIAGRGVATDALYPAVASALDITPTSGGTLAVTSGSAIPPTGISVVSENAFEGPLAITGELPFVGTTVVEGDVPSAGAGAINHACGDGVTAMVSETAAFVPEAAITPGAAITPVAASIAPTAAVFGPAAPVSPANRFAAATAPGFGLGNRLGLNGCGGRGLMH